MVFTYPERRANFGMSLRCASASNFLTLTSFVVNGLLSNGIACDRFSSVLALPRIPACSPAFQALDVSCVVDGVMTSDVGVVL